MQFELPKLPYAHDALEPVISKKQSSITTVDIIKLM